MKFGLMSIPAGWRVSALRWTTSSKRFRARMCLQAVGPRCRTGTSCCSRWRITSSKRSKTCATSFCTRRPARRKRRSRDGSRRHHSAVKHRARLRNRGAELRHRHREPWAAKDVNAKHKPAPGKPAIILQVKQQQDGNTVQIVKDIKATHRQLSQQAAARPAISATGTTRAS